jgi:deoxyxylulose-5-phosphate synthase
MLTYADKLAAEGIQAEVINLRSIRSLSLSLSLALARAHTLINLLCIRFLSNTLRVEELCPLSPASMRP